MKIDSNWNDDKKIRASRISLNQKFTVPCAKRLSNHLAWLRMYGGLSFACSHARARNAVAANVIDVMEGKKVRLVGWKRMLGCAARSARERNRQRETNASRHLTMIRRKFAKHNEHFFV